MRSVVVAVLGLAIGVAAVFLTLPAGLLWATRNADRQVIAVRKSADLPAAVRLVGPPGILSVDPKHPSDQPSFQAVASYSRYRRYGSGFFVASFRQR